MGCNKYRRSYGPLLHAKITSSVHRHVDEILEPTTLSFTTVVEATFIFVDNYTRPYRVSIIASLMKHKSL